ncbi:MAG: thioredoxin family protein [Lentisphaeria bacterium]|nr:thioredoxin family protein [Lentisphaeria bacterium]
MFKRVLLTIGLCVSSMAASAMPTGWTDDFEAAKKTAAEEGKDLLVNFSGSDWCGWCKKLDGEVFSKPEFVEAASKDFVLVLIDSPKDKSVLSDTAKENNPTWVKQYEIRGYPSVLLMNAAGEVYAKTGYQRGGVEPYLKNVIDLKKKNAAFAELMAAAEALDGVAKAKKLDEALSSLSEDVRRGKIAIMNDMLAADPEDAAGLKKKYAFYTEFLPLEKTFNQKQSAALAPLNDKFRGLKRDDPDVNAKVQALQAEAANLMKPVMTEKLKALDELLATTAFDGENKQAVLLAYVQVYQVLGEAGKMKDAMAMARDAAPETRLGQSLAQALEKMAQTKDETETPD